MTENWRALIDEKDFPEEGVHVAVVDGWRVFVAKSEGEFYAVNDRCTHAGSILSTGRIRRGQVMCPMHGARFDLATGRCAGGAYQPIRTFPLRIVDGRIEVEIPSEPPGMADTPIALS